jgi:hypothetical protein
MRNKLLYSVQTRQEYSTWVTWHTHHIFDKAYDTYQSYLISGVDGQLRLISHLEDGVLYEVLKFRE